MTSISPSLSQRVLFISVLLVLAINTSIGEEVQVTQKNAGSHSFPVPEGVEEITVEVWGAGGSGERANRGGGGGGAYSRDQLNVSPGQTNTYFVGAGAPPDSESPGGNSWFGESRLVLASGGGSASGRDGALGGQEDEGIGTTRFSGGSGAPGAFASRGGGGGSSAGSGREGGDAFEGFGGFPPAGGGGGGNAGSTEFLIFGSAGESGTIPGGGGGGGGTLASGGAGANGQVRITYTRPYQACSDTFRDESGINQNLLGSNRELDLNGVPWADNPWPDSGSTLSRGTYYLESGPEGNNYELDIAAGEQVVLFVNGSLTLKNKAELNAGGEPDQLTIVTRENVSTGNNLVLNGFVYAAGTISTGNGLEASGAFAAAGAVDLGGGNQQFEPNPSSSENIAIPDVCGPPQAGGEASEIIIDAPGQASVCRGASITLSVVNDSGELIADYSGAVGLETSSSNGSWSLDAGEGNLSDPTAGDGEAVYVFDEADNGTVDLLLANQFADTLTISAVGDEIGGTSSPFPFRENVFVISLDSDPLGNDVIAGRPHELQVSAIGRFNNEQCGTIEEYNGSVPLEVWIARDDDPGGAAPSLNGVALPSEAPGSNNLTLEFEEGTANAMLSTSDVGRYELNLLDQGRNRDFIVDEAGQPLPVLGVSRMLRPRPFALDIQLSGEPDQEFGATPSGPRFTAAGKPFGVNVRAVLWEAGQDSDDDGFPDGHIDPEVTPEPLSGNDTVPSFSLSRNQLELTANTLLDTGDFIDPGLLLPESLPGFDAGTTGAFEVRYPEVGAIRLGASFEGMYLNEPIRLSGARQPVGRFHPEAFTAQVADDGAFAPECNGFVYSGQPHGYDPDQRPEVIIVPRGWSASGQGEVLENYQGDWQKLTVGDIARNFPSEDLKNSLPVDAGPEDGRLTPLGDGTMLYQFRGDEFTYTKNQDARVAPFDSNLKLDITGIDDGDAQLASDQDLVSLNPASVEIRYGRLQIGNAYGPETLPLTLPMTAQYWTENQAFERNMDESCWTYDTGDAVSLSPENFTSVAGIEDTLLEGKPLDGSELVLEAPGEGNTGEVRATFEVPGWLQDDFSNDGELENPSGLATFGVFRGHDRIIYWREVQ